MFRPTLHHWRKSDGPKNVGICSDDVEACAKAVNSAQQRILHAPEQNDEGWFGTWAEVAFSVEREHPYITTPRGIARLEMVDVAGHPIPLNNQFHEYMLFGSGRMPKCDPWRLGGFWHNRTAGFIRNMSVTFTDLSDGPQQIQVYATNPADTQPNAEGKTPRVFVSGLLNGTSVVTQDNGQTVQGEYITLASPFAVSQFSYDSLTGLQKDMTQGDVQIFQSDPFFGSLQILSVMEPTETTAWYRRYYLDSLPRHCHRFERWMNKAGKPGCPCRPKEYVLVTALAKLDLIPVVADSDYLTIPNTEAITLEAQAIRMSRMDDPSSRQQSETYHKQAIRQLIGQLTHMEGKNNPSINFRPFGSADLEKVMINMI